MHILHKILVSLNEIETDYETKEDMIKKYENMLKNKQRILGTEMFSTGEKQTVQAVGIICIIQM